MDCVIKWSNQSSILQEIFSSASNFFGYHAMEKTAGVMDEIKRTGRA